MTSICTAIVLAIDPEIQAKRESILKQLRDGTLPPLAKYMSESMEHANSNCSYTLAELKKVHEELTLLNDDEDNHLFWTNTYKPSLYHRTDQNGECFLSCFFDTKSCFICTTCCFFWYKKFFEQIFNFNVKKPLKVLFCDRKLLFKSNLFCQKSTIYVCLSILRCKLAHT